MSQQEAEIRWIAGFILSPEPSPLPARQISAPSLPESSAVHLAAPDARANAQLGRRKEVNGAPRRAKIVPRQSFLDHVRKCPSWFRVENHEHMPDGLRKPGWRAGGWWWRASYTDPRKTNSLSARVLSCRSRAWAAHPRTWCGLRKKVVGDRAQPDHDTGGYAQPRWVNLLAGRY